MPISPELWRAAVNRWVARIQRGLIIRRGMKRWLSCASSQEGASSPSGQSHSGERKCMMKRKGRKKGKDESFADTAITAGEVYDGPITPAPISRCFERDMLTDSSAWNPAGPALKELVCTGLGVLFTVIMILLLKSGDVEPNPGPLEGALPSVPEVLKEYEDEFIQVVYPKFKLLKLVRKKVITQDIETRISATNDDDGNEILYHHLKYHGSVHSLREYCEVAMAADSYPNMQKLADKIMQRLSQGVMAEQPIQLTSQGSTESEEDASELVVAIACNTSHICKSDENTMMETQLRSQESTNSEEDASELVVGITCNTVRLLQPFELQYTYQVSCRREVLIEEFCCCRKLLGNNVIEAHEHWREVVAQVKIDPVVKACALSFSVISTPETTTYLQKHWNDLQRRMVHGSPDYLMACSMVQYALAWAMRSQDLGTALSKVKTCYHDMKKYNLDNVFLAPYYTVTIGRWIFEANGHNLSDGVIAEVLQYADETLHLIATLEEDWARIDAFGAKISALNLLLLVANYLYRQSLHCTDRFKDLYFRIQLLCKEICQDLSQNRSRVVLYDQAWFHSVSATYYQLASDTATTQEEKDRMYSLRQDSLARAARLYNINGRWWRSREEAERADNPDMIREYAKHGRSAPPV